ncbi:MAG: adenylosuccinate synthase [Chlamydiales bacterium]|nr:adenylosuccinate synthase [Chlamydiales bacterium]
MIIVGMQWGDEGKGKVIDLFSEKAEHIARAQGGNNAGHTVIVEGAEYRFHLVPSGILYPHTTCYIGGGTVIDPDSLLQEIRELEALGVTCKGRLFVSAYAHVVMPYHRLQDREEEREKGSSSVGTTGRGIGPCYADKIGRLGIRVAELLCPDAFRKQLEWIWGYKKVQNWDVNAVAEQYGRYAEQLAPYVGPVEELLFEADKKGEKILFEGAQGALLDVTFGTYPFVTSSCTLSGGMFSGLGIGPKAASGVLGVAKAYTTRVGQGPFPTEFKEESFFDHTAAREIGVTTGRKRRMGWLDAFMLRHTAALNGIDSLALMKLDILDKLEEIKVCVGYTLNGQLLQTFPVISDQLSDVEPVYETFAGWKEPTGEIRFFEDLPSLAQTYIRFLEQFLGVEVALISVGPQRHQTIWRKQ